MSAIRLLFILNGIAVAVILPFASVILADRGFDPAGIGVVIAVTSLASVVSVSAWGHAGDVVLGRARAMQAAVLAAAGAIIVFSMPLALPIVGLAYVAFAGNFVAVGPLTDALAVNAMRDPARQYGRVRAMTSASFMVASIGLGLLYGAMGYGPAAVVFGVVAVAMVLVGALRPRVPVLRCLLRAPRGPGDRRAVAVWARC